MGTRVAIVVAALAVLAVLAPAASAEEKPNPAFAGRILLSERELPVRGKSLDAYNAQLRKQCTTSFVEDVQWKIHYAAFLRSPLAGTSYTVKLYDHSNGRKRMVIAIKKTVAQRGQTTLRSELALQGSVLGTRKRLQMTVENQGDVLAEVWFEIHEKPAPEDGED